MIIQILLGGLSVLLAALLFMIAVILCTPLKLDADIDTRSHPAARLKIAALGGLVPFGVMKHDPDEEKQTEEKPQKPNDKPARSSFSAHIPRMLRAGPRMVGRILSCFKIEWLEGEIEYGLGDPADTGMLYGMVTPFIRRFTTRPGVQLNLRPDFGKAVFTGKGRVALHLTPVTLLAPLLAFSWSVFIAPRIQRL